VVATSAEEAVHSRILSDKLASAWMSVRRLELLFRGPDSGGVGIGNSFALRGADRALELRDELLTQVRRGRLPRDRPVFLGFAAIRILFQRSRSPRWHKEKMPGIGDVHKRPVFDLQRC